MRIFVLVCALVATGVSGDAAETVREMFYHGYNGYMKNAYPKDELKPISCKGHDTLGGYSLTLFDAVDTLAVLQDKEEFARVVGLMAKINFNRDHTVSVFETNIRVLGSLISAHLLASDSSLSLMPNYGGELLPVAADLGNRLLAAFATPTHLPYGSINLQRGINPNETPVSATATAGTILIEFGLLSNLTGDAKYMNAASTAARELWKRRSSLGLLASHINVISGEWVYFDSGVSGGIDSFFEYLLKAHLLFGDDEWLRMFEEGYATVIRVVKRGPFYPDVHMGNGQIMFPFYRSLQSFWPGLQVIYGDTSFATETFAAMHSVWREYGFVPEAFNLQTHKPEPGYGQYPLRPELAESAFYLYRATHNEAYRDAGRDIIRSLNTFARVECGFAAIENVTTKETRDHMDSYFLAETLKYLFLLFDETPETAVYRDATKFVFNTEAHLMPLPTPPADEFLTRPGHTIDLTARNARLANIGQPGVKPPSQKRGWKKNKK